MEYTLRTLKSDDLFPMFNIMNKIGFKEIKEGLSKDKLSDIMKLAQGEAGSDASVVGFSVVMEVLDVLIKNLPKCKTELYDFISSISGLTVEAIGELPLPEFAELVIQILQKDDFKDFIKVVSKLFK